MSLPRQIEVAVANGKTTPVARRENDITEQTYYRWRKKHYGLQGSAETEAARAAVVRSKIFPQPMDAASP